MSKRILAVLLLPTLLALNPGAATAGTEGHGGDPDEIDFVTTGRKVAHLLGGRDSGVTEIDADRFNALIDRIQVRFTQEELRLEDRPQPLTALNFQAERRILVNRVAYRALDAQSMRKLQFVFHEYLCAAGLADVNYEISSKLRAIPSDLPVDGAPPLELPGAGLPDGTTLLATTAIQLAENRLGRLCTSFTHGFEAEPNPIIHGPSCALTIDHLKTSPSMVLPKGRVGRLSYKFVDDIQGISFLSLRFYDHDMGFIYLECRAYETGLSARSYFTVERILELTQGKLSLRLPEEPPFRERCYKELRSNQSNYGERVSSIPESQRTCRGLTEKRFACAKAVRADQFNYSQKLYSIHEAIAFCDGLTEERLSCAKELRREQWNHSEKPWDFREAVAHCPLR